MRDGIPDFSELASGLNKKYQHLYDRIAALYDPALRAGWLRPKKDFRTPVGVTV